MSGTTIELFRRQTFNFAGANGSSVIIRSLDVQNWLSGVLAVRIHANSITAGTISVKVSDRQAAPLRIAAAGHAAGAWRHTTPRRA